MTNIFMQQVRDAVNFSFKNFFKYFAYKKALKKFIKKISGGSPSFGVLWNFADFIKYCERIFAYNNTKDNRIYSSNGYVPMQNGFRLRDDIRIITVKMFSDDQQIGIDIENLNGSKLKQSYVFKENQWTIEPDEYDILLIDQITEKINQDMLGLLDWAIKTKLGYFDKEEYVA